MADLVTLPELRTWTREDIPDDDPFALAILKAVSIVVRDEGLSTWEIDTAPERVLLIAQMLAFRSYTNPSSEVQTTTGPVSARVVEEMAKTLVLTEDEKAKLHELAEEPEAVNTGLWTQRTRREEMLAHDATIYAPTLPWGPMGATPIANAVEGDFLYGGL